MPTIQELRQQLDAELAGIEFTQHIPKAERDAAEQDILRYKEEGYPYLHPDTEAQLPDRIKQAPNRRAIARIGEEYRKTADQVIKAREAESALKAAETPPSWMDRLTRSRQEILDRHAPLPAPTPPAASTQTPTVPRPEAILAPPVARAPVGVARPPDVTPFSVPAEEAEFQRWYAGHAKRFGLPTTPGEEYRAAFAEGVEPDAQGHLPSTPARPAPAESAPPRLPTSALHSQVRAPGIIESPETSGLQGIPRPSPAGYRELVEPFVEAGKSTVYRGPTQTFDWLSEQIGRIAGKDNRLSQTLTGIADLSRQKASGQPVDPTLATKVLSDLGKFSTGEMPKLLAFTTALGTIPGFAALGAIEGSNIEGTKADQLKGAVVGALKNALFGAELKAAAPLAMPQRTGVGAAAFTGQAAAEGERDPEKLLAAAASGALFTFPGPVQGLTLRQAMQSPSGPARPPGANVFERMGLDPDTATIGDARKALVAQAGRLKEATATATDTAQRQALTAQFQGLLKDYATIKDLLGVARPTQTAPSGPAALPPGTVPRALPRPDQYAPGDYVTRTPGESPRRIADVQTRDGVEYVQLAGDQSYVPAARVALARRKGEPPPPADLSKAPAATLPEALQITSPQERGPFLIKTSPEERATQVLEAVAQTKPTPFPVERLQPPDAAVFNTRQEVKRQAVQRERAVETQQAVERALQHRPVPTQRDLAVGRETAVPRYLPLQPRPEPVMRPEAMQATAPEERPTAPELAASTPEPTRTETAQPDMPSRSIVEKLAKIHGQTAEAYLHDALDAMGLPELERQAKAAERVYRRTQGNVRSSPQSQIDAGIEWDRTRAIAQEARQIAQHEAIPDPTTQPRSALPPEQSAELYGRALKAQADLDIAGSERGGRYFLEQQGQGSTPEVRGLKSPTASWFKEATTGPAKLSKQRVQRAVQKILADQGRDTGKDVQRIKELLLADREFMRSEFAPQSEADWQALIAEATSGQAPAVATPPSVADLVTGLQAKAGKPEQVGLPMPVPLESGQRPIIGREATPEEAPLFSKQAQTPEPEQGTLPSEGATAKEPFLPYGLRPPRYTVQAIPPEGVFGERYQVMDRLEGRPASRFPSTSREVAEDIADHLNAGGALMEKKVPYAQPTYKTRPGADRQLSLDFSRDALADLDRASRDVSTVRGALDRPDRGREKPRVLAQDFRPELIKTGRIDLRGQTVTSSRDLAMVAQVFRDPRFETFRVFYTKDGKVVAHEGVTSRLAGSTAAWIDAKPFDTVAQEAYGKPFAKLSLDQRNDVIAKTRAPAIERMKRRMERLGADGYWLLHNHPSSSPAPSWEDISVTQMYQLQVPGLKGHVVINSGKYAVIEPGKMEGRLEALPDGFADQLREPSTASPILGTPIRTTIDLLKVGKALQQSDRYVTVLYWGGSEGKVRAIQEVPVSLFTSPQAANYLRNQARQLGGVWILTAYQGSEAKAVERTARQLIEDGILLDHAMLNTTMQAQEMIPPKPGAPGLGGPVGQRRSFRVQEPSQRYDLQAIQAEADRTREKNSILLSDIAAEHQQRREARRQANQTPLFQGFDVPAETTLDLLRQKLQDKMHRLKVIQEVVTKDAGPITDQADAYLQEELFHGRTEHALNRLDREHVTPLLRSLKEAGVSLEQLDAYLYAKHAPERNAAIDAINPKFREAHLAGSGLTNEQAAAILQRFEDQGLTEKLIPLAERVYAINRARLRLLDQSGLETPEALAAYAQKYQYYVPLRGQGVTPPEDLRPRTGKGFDIRGQESKRALGRHSLALSPTAQTVMQMEESLIRAEKNRVGQAFLKLVEEHPDPSLWEINKVVTKPRFDERTGEVRSGPDPFHRLADNVLSVKRNGEEHYITLHDQALARSMKNLGAEHTGQVVRILGAVNRYFAMLATSLNPEFLISNPIRDIQTAGVNMTEQHSLKFSTDVVRDVPRAILGAWRASRGQTAGDWTAMAERFESAGGKTGYFATKDLARTQADLAAKLQQADGGAVGAARTLIRAMGDLIADANNALENGTRLSVFRHALDDLGMSDERAASLAKNVTVNFNRRGELGTLMNSLYLFYNASLQGSVRLLQALRSPLVQKIVAGITVGSFALTELNRLIGGQDPEDGLSYYDKIDDWIKEHNLILMRPDSGGRYLKLPLPYGYNVFHILGASLSDVAHGAPPLDEAKQLVLAILNSFNPIGSDAGIIQTLSPTITDPIVEIGLNQNFYGAPIKPEQPDYGLEKPESQLFWNSVSPLSKKMAQALNRLTGGSETVPGRLDISPEILDYVVGTLTGGTGQFLNRTANLAERLLTGEPVPVRSVPFARRLLGEQSEYDTGRRYRKQAQEVQQVAAAYDLLVAQGKRAEATAYRQSHAKELALTTLARQTQNDIKPWQHQLNLVRAKEEGGATKTPQIERSTQMIERYRKRFNRAYREIMEGRRQPPSAWVREAESRAREEADQDREDMRQMIPRQARPMHPLPGVPLP